MTIEELDVPRPERFIHASDAAFWVCHEELMCAPEFVVMDYDWRNSYVVMKSAWVTEHMNMTYEQMFELCIQLEQACVQQASS